MHFSIVSFAVFLAIINNAAGAPAPQSGLSANFPDISELTWCLVPTRVNACLKANDHATAAATTAGSLYSQASLHNGVGDAFRHCYWNARMAFDLGVDTAKNIADNHEASSGGPRAEVSMDLANNASGRSIGGSASSYAGAQASCRQAADSGSLVVL